MFKTICKLALTTLITVPVALVALHVLTILLVAAPVLTLTAMVLAATVAGLIARDVSSR